MQTILWLRALKRLSGAFAIGLTAGIILWILRLCGQHALRKRWQMRFNQAMVDNWHINVAFSGQLAPAPTLLVANHCSYLDVFVLGSCGNMRFTPKDDVKRWPLIGRVIRSFDVIYVSRERASARQAQEDLQQALQEGSRICIFPEGTTNDGRQLKPFKATLFSLAEAWQGSTPLHVQPVVIRYMAINGKRIEGDAWDKIAWYGDMELLPHLWDFCQVRNVDVSVECLPPLYLSENGSRKTLSAAAFTVMHDKLTLG